jgi:hypothetical protein
MARGERKHFLHARRLGGRERSRGAQEVLHLRPGREAPENLAILLRQPFRVLNEELIADALRSPI